jgi:hypothetical protein
MACRSRLFRILQLAEDEGAIATNPVRRVPAPKRRVNPDRVFAEVKHRALTPEEAGRLLARFPLFWWDHVLCLLGTGLRFGEFAGLRSRRVPLDRPIPVLQVVDTRYQAGRFGSGFKPRPKSDAGIREIPLAPLVAEAIRCSFVDPTIFAIAFRPGWRTRAFRRGSSMSSWVTSAAATGSWRGAAGSAPATGTPPTRWPPESSTPLRRG